MKFSDQYKKALARCKDNPTDNAPVSELSSGFWSMLIDTLGELVREKNEIGPYLEKNSDFISYGICKELQESPDEISKQITANRSAGARLQIMTMTEWLSDLGIKIKQGDKKEQIEKTVQCARIQIRKMQSELQQLQEDRRLQLEKHLADNPGLLKQVVTLIDSDQLLFESIKSKRSITRGVFFSVEQKREHFSRETQLQKELSKAVALYENVRDRDAMLDIKKIASVIEQLLTRINETDEQIAKLSDELQEIERKQQEISPLEVESRLRKEIEYLRDLVKLSAKRLHMESCPVLKPGEKPFTFEVLNQCIDRVIEFDPFLFKNDRVSIFGRPSVMIVPGGGNTLYDWKNNRLLVPIVPPGGSFMKSFAAGIIEYRLDVDEDKKLLTSYNQMPDMKAIRSIFQLRLNLTKDYITWMTSEYNGYRILTKDAKEWFEHEIAPSKNEIYTPLEYQQFMLTGVQYKELLASIEGSLKENLEECENNDLWVGSILLYQQGKFQQSLELLSALLKKEPDNLMVLYNAGLLGMKLMNKQMVVSCFGEYCSRNPQSWWARIARDHLRRFQG